MLLSVFKLNTKFVIINVNCGHDNKKFCEIFLTSFKIRIKTVIFETKLQDVFEINDKSKSNEAIIFLTLISLFSVFSKFIISKDVLLKTLINTYIIFHLRLFRWNFSTKNSNIFNLTSNYIFFKNLNNRRADLRIAYYILTFQ